MKTSTRIRAALQLASLLVFVLAAGGASVAVAADDEFSCDTSGSKKARLDRAHSLAHDAFSFERMGCAADLLSAASRGRADDLEIQLDAARVLTQTLDFLRILRADDLMGVNDTVAQAIEKHAAGLKRVAIRASKIAPGDSRTLLFRALAARDVDGSVDLEGLAKVVESNPDTEGGLAQLVYGRSLYELPTFLGGNGQRAIEFLEQARTRSPRNPRALRYLAEAYDLEGHPDKALNALGALQKLEPDAGEEQRLGDELRHAIALSKRLGDESLAAVLLAEREKLFTQHPMLLTRTGRAAAGHGGPNPLTGE